MGNVIGLYDELSINCSFLNASTIIFKRGLKIILGVKLTKNVIKIR